MFFFNFEDHLLNISNTTKLTQWRKTLIHLMANLVRALLQGYSVIIPFTLRLGKDNLFHCLSCSSCWMVLHPYQIISHFVFYTQLLLHFYIHSRRKLSRKDNILRFGTEEIHIVLYIFVLNFKQCIVTCQFWVIFYTTMLISCICVRSGQVLIWMAGEPQACLHVPSASQTWSQVKAFRCMLDRSSLRPPGHGKAHSSARTAVRRRMPWKANGPVASRFCSIQQPILVAARKIPPFLFPFLVRTLSKFYNLFPLNSDDFRMRLILRGNSQLCKQLLAKGNVKRANRASLHFSFSLPFGMDEQGCLQFLFSSIRNGQTVTQLTSNDS